MLSFNRFFGNFQAPLYEIFCHKFVSQESCVLLLCWCCGISSIVFGDNVDNGRLVVLFGILFFRCIFIFVTVCCLRRGVSTVPVRI
jgi:hypothetical protein